MLHTPVQLSQPCNPPLQRGALGCGKELTPSRDLPGRKKSAGKMSPWLFLGWSHHCPLPKDRAKSVVAAEPMITVHYTPALPGAKHSSCPPLNSTAAHGPGAGAGAAKSHDVPQGFACSKNGPCVPRRESWQGRARRTPSPGARVLARPCLTLTGLRKEPGSCPRAREEPLALPSSSGFK